MKEGSIIPEDADADKYFQAVLRASNALAGKKGLKLSLQNEYNNITSSMATGIITYAEGARGLNSVASQAERLK